MSRHELPEGPDYSVDYPIGLVKWSWAANAWIRYIGIVRKAKAYQIVAREEEYR